MISGEVCWNEGKSRTFGSPEELQQTLAELDQQFTEDRRTLIEIRRAEGGTLRIGLGDHNYSFLSHIPQSGEPPYYHSVGGSDTDEVITYYFYGELTELPKHLLIPKILALDVVNEFIEFGRLSERICWEQD